MYNLKSTNAIWSKSRCRSELLKEKNKFVLLLFILILITEKSDYYLKNILTYYGDITVDNCVENHGCIAYVRYALIGAHR